jgi:rod shape-determining protein MreC
MAPLKKNLKSIIVLIIIIVLCVIVITISFKDVSLLEKAKSKTLDFFKPVQEKTFLLFQPISRFFNNINDYFKLREKMLAAKDENAVLLKDYSENINLKIENESLRKILGLQIREEHKTMPAKVIGFYENNWQSQIILNVGKRNGILEGMAVITEKGLVGVIVLSSNNTSEVRLINDPQSSIGARVLSSRKLGIVEGGLDKKVYLNYIMTSEDIFKGDILITSEFGEYIPSEILIGRIKKVSIVPNNPYKQIEIEPFVDFKKLENVLIIKG